MVLTMQSIAKNGIYGIFLGVMSFIKRLLLQFAVGVLGLYLSDYLLSGIEIINIKSLFCAGIALGAINFFIRPIVRFITFPIRILTLGLFTFFINIAIIWVVQEFCSGILISGFSTLLYTTIIIWAMEIFLHTFSK